MKKILIVGYGIIGKLEYKILEKLKPDVYDKYNLEVNTKKENFKYDYCFICVPTPLNENNQCDITEVEDAIKNNESEIYIIKSTVVPGTIDYLKNKYNKRIIFIPEHSGATQHCNNFDYNFTILGGDKADCIEVIQLLQNIYDARHTFRLTDSKTAELSKYMLNSYLAMKVSFCSQFYQFCEDLNISYEELRELFILDDRINPAHTFIYRDKPYWDSHCFNKDIPALISSMKEADLLKSMFEFNNKCKNK